MIHSIYKKLSNLFYGTGISKVPLIRKTHLKVTELTKPDTIDVFGFKMHLDEKDDACHSITTDKETNELKFLKKIIKKGDYVVDIGANIGYYTLFFASLVGPTGKVFAFEPEPKNFSILKKNVENNLLDNVIIYQKAVGSKNKNIKMKLSDSIGFHHISDHGDLDLDCIRLDDHIQNVNFIKMDAEGYEVEILKGMPNLLQRNVTIMSEFNYKLLQKYNSPSEFFKILGDAGFKFLDMRKRFSHTNLDITLKNYNESSGATDILRTKNDFPK